MMAAAPKRRPFTPADLLKQVLITGLTVSPDGEQVVYARRTIEGGTVRSRLWQVPTRGGRPRRLTTAAALDTEPRFAPDGGRVLFLSDRSGTPQPWTLPVGGGEPQILAELPEGASAADWSPSGDAVACLGDSGEHRFWVGDPKEQLARRVTEMTWRFDGRGIRDQHQSAWVVPASGRGKPRRVTDPGTDVGQAFWSPDGARIGFTADRSPTAGLYEHQGLWSVPRAGGTPSALAEFDGAVLAAAWGPGGVVFTGWPQKVPAWQNVGLFVTGARGTAAARRQVRRLAADEDMTFWPWGWSELLPDPATVPPLLLDGERIVVQAHDRGRCLPYLLGPDERPRALVAPDTDTDVAVVATGGGRMAAIACVAGDAADIYELTPDEGLRRTTTDGSRWFGPFHRPAEEIVVAHQAGHEVQGWLTRARGRADRPRPLVFEIHGGPYDAAGPTRLVTERALADAGHHVLALNPRGSVGFGEGFARALHGQWGQPDSEDLLAVLDWAVAQGLADPARVGIYGLSYGGFMVHHLLGAYPGRFKAAVSENPFTFMPADLGAGDTGAVIEEEVGVGPWPEDLEGWLEASPAMRIHRNEAPLLLLQSDQDFRCPPIHSEVAFAILKRLGRIVEMVRYPEESHTMVTGGRPDRRVDRMTRIVAWFRRHL